MNFDFTGLGAALGWTVFGMLIAALLLIQVLLG
jgi:hypothetical protein